MKMNCNKITVYTILNLNYLNRWRIDSNFWSGEGSKSKFGYMYLHLLSLDFSTNNIGKITFLRTKIVAFFDFEMKHLL